MSKVLKIKEVTNTSDSSKYGYGLAIFNNRLNTSYNDNGKMCVRSYSGTTRYSRYEEDGHKYISEGSKAPALCNYQDKLYLANREPSDEGYSEPVLFSKYLSSTNWDNNNFSSSQMNGVEPETDKGPAMIVFNNQMHLVLKKNSHHLIQHCWFDGTEFHWYNGTSKHAIPFTGSGSGYDTWEDDDNDDQSYLQTEQKPALTIVGNKLITAFKNCGSKEGTKPVVIAEFDGTNWSNDQIVKHDNDTIVTDLGPGLAYYKGNLWLVYVDHNSQDIKYLYFSNSENKWRGNNSLDNSLVSSATIRSKSTPNLLAVTVGGEERLALSFADRSGNIQLYYLDTE